MKRIFLLLLSMATFLAAYSSVPPSATATGEPLLNAKKLWIPIGSNSKMISLMELATIRPKELETLRGEKMRFFDKIMFRLAQQKLKKQLDADGNMKSGFFQKKGKTDFHLGGFALGFLLNIYGVIIAYFIRDDKKKARVMWAWIGLGTVLVLSFIVLALVALANFE